MKTNLDFMICSGTKKVKEKWMVGCAVVGDDDVESWVVIADHVLPMFS